jgi:hypothetical protein
MAQPSPNNLSPIPHQQAQLGHIDYRASNRQSPFATRGSRMKGTFRVRAQKPRGRFSRWAILGVVAGLANVHAEPQLLAGEQIVTSPPKDIWTPSTALPEDLDPLRGTRWGRGGPWADQEPYMPRPKPLGWVDPEPSRWPWTGERDPYDHPNRSQLDDAPWQGPGPRSPVGAMPAYGGAPPP